MATTLERLFLRIRPFWGTEQAPLRFTAIAANAARSPVAAWKILRRASPAAVCAGLGLLQPQC